MRILPDEPVLEELRSELRAPKFLVPPVAA